MVDLMIDPSPLPVDYPVGVVVDVDGRRVFRACVVEVVGMWCTVQSVDTGQHSFEPLCMLIPCSGGSSWSRWLSSFLDKKITNL